MAGYKQHYFEEICDEGVLSVESWGPRRNGQGPSTLIRINECVAVLNPGQLSRLHRAIDQRVHAIEGRKRGGNAVKSNT